MLFLKTLLWAPLFFVRRSPPEATSIQTGPGNFSNLLSSWFFHRGAIGKLSADVRRPKPLRREWRMMLLGSCFISLSITLRRLEHRRRQLKRSSHRVFQRTNSLLELEAPVEFREFRQQAFVLGVEQLELIDRTGPQLSSDTFEALGLFPRESMERDGVHLGHAHRLRGVIDFSNDFCLK